MSKGRTATRSRTRGRGKSRRKGERPAELTLKAPPPAAAIAWRGPQPGLSTCPVSVRATTQANAAAVAALWMELCRLHEGLGAEWALAEGAAERYARGVAAAAGNPRMIFLVAEMEVGGAWRIAGFLHAVVKLRSSVFRESVVGEIPAICVAADSAGRGVGSALVAAAMDWFQKRGLTHAEAPVAASNTPARAFFRSSGFRESASILWAEVPPALASTKIGETRKAEDLLAQGPDPFAEA